MALLAELLHLRGTAAEKRAALDDIARLHQARCPAQAVSCVRDAVRANTVEACTMYSAACHMCEGTCQICSQPHQLEPRLTMVSSFSKEYAPTHDQCILH